MVRRRWEVDFTDKKSAEVAPPPGYSQSHTNESAGGKKLSKEALDKKRAWAIALAPAKNIPMTMFMMWMSGDSVNIFSMSIVFFTAFNGLKSLFTVNSAFKGFDRPSEIIQERLFFALVQLATVLVALWKCSSLGILPTAPSDWAFRYHSLQTLEISSI
eukprot:c6553_g2_i1.p1 GENE.c6553_g2_i1~~c6553_g2_i1.p1  ORF type:complete len:159 (+),score=21.49 c6553_g2_i1:39-515(+)